MKKVLVCAIAPLLVAVAVAVSTAEPSTQATLSATDVSTLLRTAHSPVQYHALALYFHQHQAELLLQAQAEKTEWQRRSQNVVGIAAKYPRPVDSARNRYEYFQYEADRAGQQAVHFDSLAAE